MEKSHLLSAETLFTEKTKEVKEKFKTRIVSILHLKNFEANCGCQLLQNLGKTFDQQAMNQTDLIRQMEKCVSFTSLKTTESL